MKNNTKRGFTLIEILIVVAIIAILASVVLIGLGPTQQAGRDARRLSDLQQVQTGLQLYFSKCGYYPGATVAGSCAAVAWSAATTWAAMSAALTGSDIGVSTVPKDPSAGHTYYYGTTNGGSSYIIAAVLESSGNAVFSTYTAPSITNYTVDGVTDCAAASTYCISL